MAIDFESLLTNKQKAALIENRIQEFAAQAFQLKLNGSTAKELGADNLDETTEEIEKSLVILEKAIEYHQKELKKYPSED